MEDGSMRAENANFKREGPEEFRLHIKLSPFLIFEHTSIVIVYLFLLLTILLTI